MVSGTYTQSIVNISVPGHSLKTCGFLSFSFTYALIKLYCWNNKRFVVSKLTLITTAFTLSLLLLPLSLPLGLPPLPHVRELPLLVSCRRGGFWSRVRRLSCHLFFTSFALTQNFSDIWVSPLLIIFFKTRQTCSWTNYVWSGCGGLGIYQDSGRNIECLNLKYMCWNQLEMWKRSLKKTLNSADWVQRCFGSFDACFILFVGSIFVRNLPLLTKIL